jgi:putative transposase
MLKRHPHTPAHLFLDNAPYFVTGAIYQKRHLLVEPKLKQTLLDVIQEHVKLCGWQLHHWVILDNHYHLLGQSLRGEDLTKIFKGIHGSSASFIRSMTHCEIPVWWNYWDYCPRNEKQYLIRLNYLLYNPVRHGYVRDLHNYPYSSFHTLFADMGRERLVQQFRDYPDYTTLILHEAYKDDF